jgi:hypothetical protein
MAAYEAQIKQLIAAEGEDAQLELVLRNELREIVRIDPADADREGARFDSKRAK